MNDTFQLRFADIASPAFYADPYPLYAKLRAVEGLAKVTEGVWVTGKYSVCDALLRDRRMGRNYMGGVRARYGDEQAKAPVFSSFARMMLLVNPPEHTRLRQLLTKAFTATQGERYVQLARRLAEDLLDEKLHDPASFDLVRDYAAVLPLRVICHLLDVPFEGGAAFAQAIGHLAQTVELAPMRPEQIQAANDAIERLEAYFRPILDARRRAPGDDLISRLLTASEGEDALSEAEILSNIVMLFFAGHETTVNMIGNALIALQRHPAQRDRAVADPSLWPEVVAEALRYDSSVQLTARSALEDLEIDGTPVRRGDTVYLFLGSANRDPEKFGSPDAFIIDRRHEEARALSFGGGLHHCLGARLATAEIEVALGVLFRRLPDLEIANIDALRWHPRNSLRGVESLRIRSR